MNWSSILPAVIPSLVALIGIPLGVKLSAKQAENAAKTSHQHWIDQRWWERKEEAYSLIVEALWQLKTYSQGVEDDFYAQMIGQPKTSKRPVEDFQNNFSALKKAAEIGAFVISNDVAHILSTFFKTIDSISDEADPIEEASTHLKAASTCLDEVKAAAMKDMAVRREDWI